MDRLEDSVDTAVFFIGDISFFIQILTGTLHGFYIGSLCCMRICKMEKIKGKS